MPRLAAKLALGLALALALALTAVPAPAAALPNRALRAPLQVGFEMPVSSVSGDTITWMWAPAADVAYTFRRNLTAGVQGLTFGSAAVAAGERSHWGLMPYIENFRFVSRVTQLFAMAGVGWQARSGAGLPTRSGWTVAAGGGARFWLTDRFSLGLLLRLTRVLSSGWMMSPRILPGGAMIAAGGFMVEGHF